MRIFNQAIPFFFITIFFLAGSASCFSQSTRDSQALISLTNRLIESYNSADTAAYRAFIGARTTNLVRITDFIKQCREEQQHLGKLRVNKIRLISLHEAEALVQMVKYEGWCRVIVITDSLHRFKEHHMGIMRVTDQVLHSKEHSGAEIKKEIEAYIRRQAQYEKFNGNVLITRQGQVIYSNTFGKNLDGQANTPDQKFGLASVGKMFTAIAILQLVDAGKLTLSDSIGKVLPELTNKKLSAITVHQLLTHTSGMGDFFEDPDFSKVKQESKQGLTQAVATTFSRPSAFLPFFEKDELRFAPGRGWSYSNTGFELLGYLIERTSGVDYKTYIRDSIFARSGMGNTEAGSGSGSGMSTVNDLTKFSNALVSGKLLSPVLTAKFLDFRENDYYGFGSEHTTIGNEHIVGHSGGFENVCNEVNIYRHSGYTVIILSNSNPPFAHFMSDKIKELLVRKK